MMNKKTSRPQTPTHRMIAASIVALSMVLPIGVAADEGKKDQAAMMAEMQAAMKLATGLGEHHQALADLIGEWDVEIALVMPGVPSQSAPGTAKYAWIIEGRWLGQHVTGTLMGMPYQGFSIIGFDGYAKNHVVASVSSMDTALNVARGVVVDPTNKTSAVYGTLDEYTTGELKKPFKVVTKIQSTDRHVVEVWDLGIGEAGAKVLEFRFKRKKP